MRGGDDQADVDPALMLLHEVRLRGVMPTEDLEREVVDALVAKGYAALAARGLRITPAGREVHTAWARFSAGSDDETTAQVAYERFLPLNRELIRICNDWQVRAGGVQNDHRDVRYDWAVIDRLRTLDERAGPVVRRVARAHVRFTVYRPRLRAALERVDEGQRDWMTSPRCDSYHTVWMQLHEDLLLALGRDRGDEKD